MSLVHSNSRVEVRRPGKPQPLRAGLPWLGLVLAALGAFLLGLPLRECVALAAGAVLVGAVRALLELRDLSTLRRNADAVLRTGARVHPYSALLTWRAGELTSERNRKILARSFRNVVRELERPSVMTAVPLNRQEAWEHVGLLAELAQVLDDPNSTVSAQGVVLVEDLLTDGVNSPLFGHGFISPADERGDAPRPSLGVALADCLAALAPVAGSPSGGRLDAGLFDINPDVVNPSAARHGRISAHGGGTR